MGRKKRGVERRREIIISFYEVAREIGIENSSIAKVAEHMKISKGLIFHYFVNKEELLSGLLEYILEQHLELMSQGTIGVMDTKEKLMTFVGNLFSRKWNAYFDDGVFYSCYALIYRIPTFRESFKSYLDELHEVLYTKLKEAAAHKIIVNENLLEISEVIFLLIDGAYYYLGMFEKPNAIAARKVETYTHYSLGLLHFCD